MSEAHGDELIGGTRRDLLDRAAVLLGKARVRGQVLSMAAGWRLGTAHH